MQFLSLVGWTDLYRGEEIAGYVKLQGTQYRVAHASKRHADVSEWDNSEDDAGRSDHRSMAGRGHYPGLYFPMLAAWDWWKVAPVRLPSSIRYLDTFAHQGGAGDRLVVECLVAFETDSEVVYRPVKPPNGYGITALPIQKKGIMSNSHKHQLAVSLNQRSQHMDHRCKSYLGLVSRTLTGRKNALRTVTISAAGMSHSRSVSALVGW